jgi:transcriptional regulator with GAF, ATPase, and Fis domain/tetratricopeptide (TPR) repeat protein
VRGANQVGNRGSAAGAIAPATRRVTDRYRLLRRIGAGSSSEVYLAEDVVAGAERAVKVYADGGEGESRRLLHEFARLGELTHRNIVRVHDLGRVRDGDFAGRPFLVTDHVGGPPLAALVDLPDPALRLARFGEAARALADALAYLHGRGIVHGDLNPANVRFDGDGRPVLLDFGLSASATPANTGAVVAGTLGYLAPEALLGERGPLTDLYALGATLYAAWTGGPPHGVGIESVQRLRDGPPPAPSAVRPGLPAAWDDLLLRLLAASPEGRPASARELLRELRALAPETGGAGRPAGIEAWAPFPEGDPLAGVFVGRRAEREALAGAVEKLAEGVAATSVVVVCGPPGSGRRTLIDRVLRDARIAAVAGGVPDFDVDERGVAALARDPRLAAPAPALPLGAAWDEPARLAVSHLGALAEALERRASAGRPLCVVLPPGPDEEALAEVVAGTEPSGRLLLVAATERPLRRGRAGRIDLGPLAAGEVGELARRAAGEAAPDEVREGIARTSGGQPALAALLVRRWVAALRAAVPEGGGVPAAAVDFSLSAPDQDLDRQLDSSFAALATDGRRLVAAVALAAPVAAAGLDGEPARAAEREATAGGWLRRDRAGALALSSALHQAAALRALRGHPELHAVAAEAARSLPATDPRLGEALLAAGDAAGAGRALAGAGRAAYEGGRFGEAARAWGRCLELAGEQGAVEGPSFEERLALAGALGVLGEYPRALAVLDGLGEGRARPAGERAAVAERRAWVLGRQGQLGAARAVLADALGALDDRGAARDASVRLPLAARLARVLVSTGELAQALDTARPALAAGAPAGAAAVAREASVVALAYGGRLAEAEALLDGGDDGRAQFLRGLCHQLAGRPLPAADAYRAAAEAHGAAADLHGAASATFNLGCVLADAGRYAEALPAFDRAVRDLGRVGASADLALALFNVGVLFVQLGDLESAGRTLRRTREESRAGALPLFEACALCLEADLHRRRRAPAAAVSLYAAAADRFQAAGNLPQAEAARLARVEALAESGQVEPALAAWQAMLAAAGGAQRSEARTLALARVILAAPAGAAAPDAAATGAAAAELEALASAAAAAGRRPVTWRASWLAGRLHARLGDPRAAALLETARRTFEEVKMSSPARFRSGLDADPDAPLPTAARPGPGTGEAAAVAAAVERTARAESRLRRLQRINKRLNSELRLSRVLETIIDTVIELTDAERGFLLLRDNAGELQVKVARNIDQKTLEGQEFALSRSIAARAADRGEPVVTIDAAGDDRFRQALSVTDLRLRSVLAVPLAVKGNVVGTIYVDHRLRKSAFNDDDVALVLDFAEQGAIAIENARLLAQLRRRERQVEALNHRLEGELKARHAELTEVRQELKESRDAAALRYDYGQIVGRTPRMLELFRLVDRVTDTSLPVVIQGESGTGKELVARAIHFNGPRRARPFVSENCAAIPETLLESTLFGYVKGAFTGADRDTRGLFSVADGGTLFLDEVGEMSPAMQGKLLRVLQDGELRRVGGERTHHVDVRIVVATNRDLGRLVSDGKFRQDLYFRLSVVRLTLPPLRERSEDVPLLVRHFLTHLARAAGAPAPKGIAPAAMAKLAAYRWPGNVRELENEITRAAAFSAAEITVADLSPHVAAGDVGDSSGLGDESPDSLRLRPRIERLERALIREALARCEGNQTRAAEALGLSRFGLQKKLRRYGIAS